MKPETLIRLLWLHPRRLPHLTPIPLLSNRLLKNHLQNHLPKNRLSNHLPILLVLVNGMNGLSAPSHVELAHKPALVSAATMTNLAKVLNLSLAILKTATKAAVM